MPAPHHPHPFAFFDLDGTLLPWDTQLLFCQYVINRQGWRRILLLPFFFCLPLAVLRLMRSRALKRVFLNYLAGIRRDQLDRLADDFASEVAARDVWPAMRAEIDARRAEGCVLVLNTASPEIYARAIARTLGFDHCFATRVAIGDKAGFFPHIIGPNNKRAAKIDAMRAAGLLPVNTAMPLPRSWAYTDSPVDIPLLECAEHGRLVHPSPTFAALGAVRGWHTLTPAPAVTRLAWRLAALRMLCGVWRR